MSPIPKKALRLLTAFILVLIFPVAASAGAYSDIFIFGDSFSDTGNVFAATGGLIPSDPPYFQGRFSDGPVWVERLASRLGLTVRANGADPQVVKGNNFAVGGALAAVDLPVSLPYIPNAVIPSLQSQVSYFIAASTPPSLPSDALYVVYAGNNDLRYAVDPKNELTPSEKDQMVEDAVTAIINSIKALAAAGAKDILVPNVGDLGITPEAAVVRNNAAESTAISMQFNTLLSDQLKILTEELGIRITLFDTFSLGKQILEDARYNGGKTFGITNVDTPIFPGYAGSPGADPAVSLFCDDLHISAVAHDLLGDAVFSYLVRPTFTLTINKKVFSSGDTLQVSLDVNNPGTYFAGDPLLVEVISTVDIYFGVLLPDGDSIAFFSTLDFNPYLGSLSHVATLSPLISNVDLSSQLTVDDLSFFSFTWTGNEPTGTYVLFLAAVVPGAFADGSVDQGDIVTLSTITFSLIP
jgi:phospholipase/lecithinase/hemolysin